ncbi:catenin alpha-3 [Protopterus annectens]|uniref:catenin alpha-3 n=1 Tax=Protopterus annectens TaxID=7888 RepID=UPI001CFB7D5B|nr:catenin alpha-3 [Protopterus annectens]
MCERDPVAKLACSVSGKEGRIKVVQMAAARAEILCPQVICAALALVSKPGSKTLQDSTEAYKTAWENNVHFLTEAVDDITNIDDFLSASENHILEDMNACVLAISERDTVLFEQSSSAVCGRAARLSQVVAGEMDNYEPGVYMESVMKNVSFLSKTAIPEFLSQVKTTVGFFTMNIVGQTDNSAFVEASKKVYDAIHDIRSSVLLIRTPEELEDVSDLEELPEDSSQDSVQAKHRPHMGNMTSWPEAENAEIAEQVAGFRKVKSKLDAEIEIWDETSNDIIVLAKQMCRIMLEMTDFTRGRGPLKNTTDVINAAKIISEAGSKLDELTSEIAFQCPDQICKQELLAYLAQIQFYSHQLRICSQVKAEIQNLHGELTMPTLDNVTSLIVAARNLMNAVVQTVKMSYVSSNKIIKIHSTSGPWHPAVIWRMKAPAKKPLIKREKPEEAVAAVRKGSTKKMIHPVKVMNEFQGKVFK